jgi:inorganic triphosphatase YgiF
LSAEVEIVFDEGTVEAGEHGQPLLKLKCGDSSALYDVGMQLLDVAPLRLGTMSKADRAMRWHSTLCRRSQGRKDRALARSIALMTSSPW